MRICLRDWMRRIAVFVALCFPVTVLADDCLSDPGRAADCLRTNGTAQPIAAGVAVAVTILVNGQSLPPLFFPPKSEGQAGEGEAEGGEDEGEGEDDEKKERKYTLDIRTTDLRTTLATDSLDSLWVYGQVQCDDPEVDTGALTQALEFRIEGDNADWVVMEAPGWVGGFKAVELWAFPPLEDDELEGDNRITVTLSTTIEGNAVAAPVTITLDEDEFGLEVEFVDEDLGAAGEVGADA